MNRNLQARITSILKKVKGRAIGSRFSSDGTQFYRNDGDENQNAGFQSYYRENIDRISKGQVPERYLRVSQITPGNRILEIGSADGTQSLVLARHKEKVCGIELMPMQFKEALKLKQNWMELGRKVAGCYFRNENVLDAAVDFNEFDTVLMSRVLYHFRDSAEAMLEKIAQSTIKNVVLVGCPIRERNWRVGGEAGDAMGKFAYLASQEGMEDILKRYGFEVVVSASSEKGDDPIVVASRNI